MRGRVDSAAAFYDAPPRGVNIESHGVLVERIVTRAVARTSTRPMTSAVPREMTLMVPSPRPYDVLLRAVHSATSELELVDIRALIAHHAGGALEEIDGVIATRRRALAARDPRAPKPEGRDGMRSVPSDIPS